MNPMKAAVTFLIAALCTGLLPVPSHADPVPTERFVNIAHRGASGLAPEHTIPAWDLALKLGADYLEQDVHLTRDGVLVVVHDDTLDRTARGPVQNCAGPVRTKTLAQLRTCDVGTWFNERYPDRAREEFIGLRIPTLAEVFERYGTRVSYYIEMKSPEAAPVVVQRELLRLLDVYGLRDAAVRDGRVLVQSFSPAGLRVLHLVDPALPLVQLLPTTPDSTTRGLTLDAIAEYAVGIGPPAGGVTAEFVAAAHELCLAVHPYTVDDPDRLAELVAMGADGVFTNRPDTLTTVMQRDPDLERTDAATAAARANRRCRAG